MGFDIGKLRGDPKLENEGVWIEEEDGLMLLIARIGNEKYRKHLRGAVNQQKNKLRGFRSNTTTEDVEERMKVAVARHVILGWKNLDHKKKDGEKEGEIEKDIPYSPEKALELFEEFPSFLDVIIEYASDMNRFRAEAHEEAAGK